MLERIRHEEPSRDIYNGREKSREPERRRSVLSPCCCQLVDFPFLASVPPLGRSVYPLRRGRGTRIGALRARDACLLVSYSIRRAARTHACTYARTHVRSSPRPIQVYVPESYAHRAPRLSGEAITNTRYRAIRSAIGYPGIFYFSSNPFRRATGRQ